MNSKLLIVLMLLMILVSCSKKEQSTVEYDTIEKKVEDDNFVWYFVTKDDKEGALNSNKEIIVPIEYTTVSYSADLDGFCAYIAYRESNSLAMELYDKEGAKKIDKEDGISGLRQKKDIKGNIFYICDTYVCGKAWEGIMDKDLKIIINPIYDFVYYSLDQHSNIYDENNKASFFKLEVEDEDELEFRHFLDDGKISEAETPTAMYIYEGAQPDVGDFDRSELINNIIGSKYDVYFFDKHCIINGIGDFKFRERQYCEGYDCYSITYEMTDPYEMKLEVIGEEDKGYIDVIKWSDDNIRNAGLYKNNSIYPITGEIVAYREYLLDLYTSSVKSGDFSALNKIYKEKYANDDSATTEHGTSANNEEGLIHKGIYTESGHGVSIST